MKTLIISEKPNQAKSYALAYDIEKREKTHFILKPCSTFPQGAIITWAIGHLVGLAMPNDYKAEWAKWDLKNLPIVPNNFEYKVSKDKTAQFNAIKKLCNDAELIINGCDCDVEGSSIFHSILNKANVKNKKLKRLWINSLEVEEIQKGFNNLQDIEKDLLMYERGKARQQADWLVGMNASQLYSLLVQKKGVRETLSIGRVQSPLVYMIYQRKLEIENFKVSTFYELKGTFKCDLGNYNGKAKLKLDSKKETENYLQEHKLLNETVGKIVQVENTQKNTKSPKLHSLSTLQTTANKKWQYSPSAVLKTMQSLYEKKLLSYPRTDCNYITTSEFDYLAERVTDYMKIINKEFKANKEPKKRYVDNSKVEEHYAIITTKNVPSESDLKNLTSEERNIYDEILKSVLCMFHEDYIYNETKIITTVNEIEFETIGKTELNKGWKEILTNIDDNDNDKNHENALPNVKEGIEVNSLISFKEGHTSPPKAYTEGGLINAMKTSGKTIENNEDSAILKSIEGIGTEATRSGIIETIKSHEYITVTKNIVDVTNKGILLCKSIEGTLLASPIMTAKWETYLKSIEKNEGDRKTFVANITKFINHLIDTAPKQMEENKSINDVLKEKDDAAKIGKCPNCIEGTIYDKNTFVSCNNKTCNFSISKKIANKSLTNKNIMDLLTKQKTTKIKGFISKAQKTFDAVLIIKDKKVSFDFSK